MFEKEIKKISEKIDKVPYVIAIDGRCGSGKSTLGKLLSEACHADLLCMDDFFLRPEQRTPERYQTPGENVDHERVKLVLEDWKKQQPFAYRKFDCHSMSLMGDTYVNPKKILVVEGSYSFHDELIGFYDLKVFLDIDPVLQKKRILLRNGEQGWKMFEERWIPLEEMYFKAKNVKEKSEIAFFYE